MDRISPHVPRFARDVTTSGVLFAVPCYGGMMHDACVNGLLDTQAAFARRGIPFSRITIRNESLVQRARNGIAAHFLASGCDRLFFVDADIGFTAEQALRLLSHDRPIVGGLYRKKRPDRVDFAINFSADAAGSVERDPETGAIRAVDVATGFLCIKRGVLERMAAALPHIRYRKPSEDGVGYEHAFFDCWIDPTTGEYLSEDYAFCRRAAALGIEVWADPGLVLEHHGTLMLQADPMEHLGGGA